MNSLAKHNNEMPPRDDASVFLLLCALFFFHLTYANIMLGLFRDVVVQKTFSPLFINRYHYTIRGRRDDCKEVE